MRKQTIAVLAATLLLVAGLAGGYAWSNRAPAPAPRLEKLVIATNTEYIGACAVIAGRDKGFFASQGIEVEIQPYSSGRASMQAVLQGKADLGTVADIPIVFAALDGVPVRVLATIFRTEKDHGLVGRRDHGIHNGASLKGKRVGVTLSTSGHFTLDVFLNWQRLESSDVTMVNYKPEQLGDALLKGEVDAIAGWDPYLKDVRDKLGDNGVPLSGENVYESIYNLVGMQPFVLTHPDTSRRLLRALTAASRWCQDNPELAHQMLPATQKLSRAELLAAWPNFQFALDLDQGMLLGLEDRARWAMRNKLTAKSDMPNFLEYMYLDGLVAVQPTAVSIIH